MLNICVSPLFIATIHLLGKNNWLYSRGMRNNRMEYTVANVINTLILKNLKTQRQCIQSESL
jgi:hypothetical protein